MEEKKLASSALDYVDTWFFNLAVSILKNNCRLNKMHKKLITTPYTKEISM